MSDIDEILRTDAARWQRVIDVGSRPVADVASTSSNSSGRRTLIPVFGGIAVIATVVLGLLLARAGNGDHRSAASGTATAAELRGVRWIEPNSGGTVVFSKDTARVFDGCSGGLYDLTADATAVVIGKHVGPESTCGGVAAPVAGPARRSYDVQQAAIAKFDQVLEGRVSWTRTGGTLILTNPKGTLTLRADGTRALQVSGQQWKLDQIASAGRELPGADNLGSLYIAADGSVRAALLCGSLTAHATITSTTITFSSVQDSAGSACLSPSALRAQGVILSVLRAKINYEIRGEQLMLDGPNATLVYDATA